MSRRAMVTGVVCFLVLGAATVAVFVWLANRTKTMSDVVKKYEFTELVPPSKLVMPGTMVRVINTNPLVVNVICPASNAFGPDCSRKYQVSNSTSSAEAKTLEGTFSLATAVEKRIKTQANADFVTNIQITLSNVRIIEIPDDAVFDLVAQRAPRCTEAINARRSLNHTVTMIKSVILASAVYRIEYRTSLAADERAAATRRIAGTLGLTSGVESAETIRGTDLIWGVRDDMDLAEVSPDHPPVTGAAGAHRRALPIDQLAEVAVDDT